MATPTGQPLDLPHQLAQMMVKVVPGALLPPQAGSLGQDPAFPSVRQLQKWIQHWGLGAVWIESAPAPEAMLRIQQLQSWAVLPLLVGADASVGINFAGTTPLPPPRCLQNLKPDPSGSRDPHPSLSRGELSREATHPPQVPSDQVAAGQLGTFTAREAKAIGINWLWGLSLDWQGGLGCFGRDPAQVTARVGAYLRAAETEAVWVSVRPPQHRSFQDPSSQDPMLLPWLELLNASGGGLELENLDLGSVRNRLAGLIIADVRRDPLAQINPDRTDPDPMFQAESHLRALRSGADLLVVDSVEQAVEGLTQAVHKGQLSPERVASSVQRILATKARLHPGSRGLLRQYWPALPASEADAPDPGRILSEASSSLLLGNPRGQGAGSSLERLVPTLLTSQRGSRALQTRLAQPDAIAFARHLLIQSLGGDPCGQLPLRPAPDWLNWIWVEDDAQRPMSADPMVARFQAKGIPTLISDSLTPLPLLEKALRDAPQIILQWIGGSGQSHPVVPHLLQDHLASLAACVLYRHPHPAQSLASILPPQRIPFLHLYATTPQAQTLALHHLLGPMSP